MCTITLNAQDSYQPRPVAMVTRRAASSSELKNFDKLSTTAAAAEAANRHLHTQCQSAFLTLVLPTQWKGGKQWSSFKTSVAEIFPIGFFFFLPLSLLKGLIVRRNEIIKAWCESKQVSINVLSIHFDDLDQVYFLCCRWREMKSGYLGF